MHVFANDLMSRWRCSRSETGKLIFLLNTVKKKGRENTLTHFIGNLSR